MKHIFSVLILSAALTAGAVDIVKNGKAAADIAIPEKPITVVKFAAEELQKHIKLMTGVQLAITSKDSPRKYANRIHVGYGQPMTLDTRHAWRVKVEKNDIYLCGNDEEIPERSKGRPEATARGWRTKGCGSLMAVYDFLDRELGVRWLYPGDNGIYFTPTKNITVKSCDREKKPRLRSCSVGHFQYSYINKWHNKKFGALYAWECDIWRLRHHLVNTKWFRVNHAFKTWWQRYGKTNPEFFNMLPDGTRRPLQGDRIGRDITMCVSSDALLNKIVELYKQGYGPIGQFKEHDTISICENDAPGMCICEKCRSWDMPEFDPNGHPYWGKKQMPTLKTKGMMFSFDDGGTDIHVNTSLTDRYAKFWLRTQKELSKLNPDVQVMGYAYANTTLPPRHVKLHKNIIVGYVGTPKYPLTPDKMAKTAAEWDGWVKTGCLLQFRPNTTWAGSVYPLQYWKPLAGEFHRILQSPQMIMAQFDTFRGEHANQGPMWYVLIRLCNNPDMTVEQIADEYFNALGRPGKYIREYFEFWEKISDTYTDADVQKLQKKLGWRIFTWNQWDICVDLFKPEHFAEAKKILAKAEKAAVTSKEKKTVKFFQLGLEHARLTEIAGEAHFARATAYTPEKQKDFEKKRAELLAFRKKHEKSWISNMALETHRDGYGYTRSVPENSELKKIFEREKEEIRRKDQMRRAKLKKQKKSVKK